MDNANAVNNFSAGIEDDTGGDAGSGTGGSAAAVHDAFGKILLQTEQRREALKAAAVLLAYPSFQSRELWGEICAWAEALQPAANQFLRAVKALQAVELESLQRVYVETFDFRPETSLFLTAHEYGDSRERGPALIRLLQMLVHAGFVPASGELADALPVLLEFLAVQPAQMDTGEVAGRIFTCCRRLADCLGAGHPYQPVFTAVCSLLPEAEPAANGFARPDAVTDLENDMPYPVCYDGQSPQSWEDLLWNSSGG